MNIFKFFKKKQYTTWNLFLHVKNGINLITLPICISSTNNVSTEFYYNFPYYCCLEQLVYEECKEYDTLKRIEFDLTYYDSKFQQQKLFVRKNDILTFVFNPVTKYISNFKINQKNPVT